MKLATRTGDYFTQGCPMTEALRRIRCAGFKYVDYSFTVDYDRKDGIYSEDYPRYLKSVKRIADEVEISLIQAHSPMGAPLADGGRLLEDTLRCIDACGAWGIPNLVVHSGYVKGLTREETIEENCKFFLPLLKRAEEYGVNILVENFNKMDVDGLYWIDNATDLLAMIESVSHPLFHAVWDVGHANMQNMPQDEELRLLGKHVKALHIHDNMGDDDSHLVPYLGNTNFDSVMCGLDDIGYDGFFTFEVGEFFTRTEQRKEYERSKLLVKEPIEVRDAFESYLYQLGKIMLTKYGCFEE